MVRQNPVKKLPLVVTGIEEQVHIDEMLPVEDGEHIPRPSISTGY
jgi:hypothetical protein